MDNLVELGHSLADSEAPVEDTQSLAPASTRVKVGIYVVDGTLYQISDVPEDNIVDQVIRTLITPFVKSVYHRYNSTPPVRGVNANLFPNGMSRGLDQWVNDD